MKTGAVRALSSLFARPRPKPPNNRIATTRPSKDLIAPRYSKSSHDLYLNIIRIGDFKVSAVPVLDQWVQEGRPVVKSDLQIFVRKLKSQRRVSHALEELNSVSSQSQFMASSSWFSRFRSSSRAIFGYIRSSSVQNERIHGRSITTDVNLKKHRLVLLPLALAASASSLAFQIQPNHGLCDGPGLDSRGVSYGWH